VNEAELKDVLRSQIHAKNAVLILGAGVSLASSEKAKSWTQLIESGAAAVVAAGCAPRADFEDTVRRRLEPPVDPYYLTEAASDVIRVLKRNGRFETWIDSEFSGLKVTYPSLIQALGRLEIPIFTTNYDTLVESVLKLHPVSPANPALMIRTASGGYPGVGHVHGVWSDPETCVITLGDYARITHDKGSGTVHRALSLTRSLVYVGFGAGIADENFEAVHNWANERFGSVSQQHFLLCLEENRSELLRDLPPDINPVSYGHDFSELPAFVTSLSRSADGSIPVIPPTFARESALRAIRERVEDESLLVRFADPHNSAGLALIAPSLLPVPPEIFGRRDAVEDPKPKRLDATSLCGTSEAKLVVGGELSGVTSALQWMLFNRADEVPEEVPLYIDARRLKGTRKNALEYEIRQKASAAGIIATPRSDLPQFSLAIDNLHSCNDRGLQAVIKDLQDLGNPHVWFGCRQGSENHLVETFGSQGFSLQTIYMGSLTKRDIGRLAELADFSDSAALAGRASAVMQQENLPRSADSISLLLSVLARGERTEPLTRVTDLIQEYVGLLMTLSGESRSAGDSLTAADLDAVCQEVSRRLCLERVGSLPLQEFVTLVQDYFSSVLISVNPTDVLERLEQSRVLGTTSGRIGFRQDSFLFFYAAKAALTDSSFAAVLKDSLVYFGPIIKYYTAAVRGDGGVLTRWLEIFRSIDRSWLVGAAFANSEPIGGPMSLEDFENAHERDVPTTDNSSRDDELDEEYGFPAEREVEPFPTASQEEARGIFLQLIVLALGSTVLSQSDQVRDPELRVTMLRELLLGHADLVDLIEQDPTYEEFIATFSEELMSGGHGEDVEKFRQTFREVLPSFMGASLLASGLASSRSRLSVKNLMADAGAMSDAKVACMASMLALVLHVEGYGDQLRRLHGRVGKSRFVRVAIRQFAESDYLRSGDEVQGSHLEDFLVECIADTVLTSGHEQRNSVKGVARQRLQTRRKTWSVRSSGGQAELVTGELSEEF